MGDDNFCTVTAVSIITGIEFGTVHKMFEQAGRAKGKGFSLYRTIMILYELGWRCTKETEPRTKRKVKVSSIYDGKQVTITKEGKYTTKTIGSVYGYKTGRYMGLISNKYESHVFAMINGTVHDWSSNRKYRVHTMYRFERM